MAVPHSHLSAAAEVVVGVDGSAGSDRAVRWAAAAAAARGRRLRLVHALNLDTAQWLLGSYDVTIPAVTETLRGRGAELLAAAADAAHRVAPELTVETELADGQPARALIAHSATAYQVVLGATGTGGTVAHLGSTLLKVVAHGRGSIVVVRDSEFDRRTGSAGPVVVGVDSGPASEPAVAAAFAEAAERHTGLVAVHAWIDLPYGEFGDTGDDIADETIATEARSMLAEQLAGWSEKYPEVPVARNVYLSGPRHHLLVWSKTAQLLVVGSRGRGGFTGLLLGSTSNAMVQRAHCPVLVAHGS